MKLTLPLGDVDRTTLPIVGGKAANLGELIRAGLPTPDGFCVTTIAYELVTEGASLDPILEDLVHTHADDTSRQAELAAAARTGRREPVDRHPQLAIITLLSNHIYSECLL